MNTMDSDEELLTPEFVEYVLKERPWESPRRRLEWMQIFQGIFYLHQERKRKESRRRREMLYDRHLGTEDTDSENEYCQRRIGYGNGRDDDCYDKQINNDDYCYYGDDDDDDELPRKIECKARKVRKRARKRKRLKSENSTTSLKKPRTLVL
eukprot:m.342467 g.342467  ORF g.342467 m.342467 type:complete len:152 (+) comp21401_c0_seq1:240-695(+)